MIKKFVVACLMSLVVVVPGALAVGAAAAPDQSAAGPSADDYFIEVSRHHDEQAAQTFTAGISGNLTSVVIALFNVCCTTSPIDNVSVAVTAVDGLGDPDLSAVLGTSLPVPNSSISTSSPTDLTFSFPAPVAVTSGTQYALVIREEGSSDHMHLYVARASATYPGGHAFWGQSGSLVSNGPESLIFTTYVAGGGGNANRLGYCSVVGNTDGLTGMALVPGTFVNLGAGQPESDPHFTGAMPANYLAGLGISCDVTAGFTPTGTTVGYGGGGDPGVYPFYNRVG
jgi:hypothetical protein